MMRAYFPTAVCPCKQHSLPRCEVCYHSSDTRRCWSNNLLPTSCCCLCTFGVPGQAHPLFFSLSHERYVRSKVRSGDPAVAYVPHQYQVLPQFPTYPTLLWDLVLVPEAPRVWFWCVWSNVQFCSRLALLSKFVRRCWGV